MLTKKFNRHNPPLPFSKKNPDHSSKHIPHHFIIILPVRKYKRRLCLAGQQSVCKPFDFCSICFVFCSRSDSFLLISFDFFPPSPPRRPRGVHLNKNHFARNQNNNHRVEIRTIITPKTRAEVETKSPKRICSDFATSCKNAKTESVLVATSCKNVFAKSVLVETKCNRDFDESVMIATKGKQVTTKPGHNVKKGINGIAKSGYDVTKSIIVKT